MKCFLGLIIFIFLYQNSKSQTVDLNSSLAKSAFVGYKYEQSEKRKILSLKNKKFIAKINPLNYIAAGALFFYQRVFSEQIQASCMYEISCSNYTKLSVQEFGIKGLLSGINQLNCCFTGVVYDYPDFMISSESKVRNQLNK
jgi:putative component of membrane protein insertase Oxa1/YidC/SpoIIIJ protein YidD